MSKAQQCAEIEQLKTTGKLSRKKRKGRSANVVVRELANKVADRGLDQALAVIRETAKQLKMSVADFLKQAGKAKSE